MPRKPAAKTALKSARLHKHVRAAKQRLRARFPQAAQQLRMLGLELGQLRQHSAKVLAAATLASALLATSPGQPQSNDTLTNHHQTLSPAELSAKLQAALQLILPNKVGALSLQVETQLHTVFQQVLGVNAVGTLDGNHLNTTYGYIGAEQHLPRYPGDVGWLTDLFPDKGITPGTGAWGYFAGSRAQLTDLDVQREKYYVAVQTLYLPNWTSDFRRLRDWYKYRKVLVVNPQNGKAVVADIADAGPAAWTGKQFGGSPEVMADLKLNTGMQKGAVILFFVDEQNTPIALGPVTAQTGQLLATSQFTLQK